MRRIYFNRNEHHYGPARACMPALEELLAQLLGAGVGA